MTQFSSNVGRRGFMTGAASLFALTAAGCATTRTTPPEPAPSAPPPIPEYARRMYRALPDEQFPIPAVDLTQLDPIYYRQGVADPTGEAPGTVVVDTPNRFLYHVEAGGSAMRYGVGIGRAGFAWSGEAHIAYKREWPTWTPPADMIAREPELEKWRNGQPPGLDNPLGARALYIHEGGRDTLYRLHGTGEVWSIGRAVSSGCVRLLHQDVIDLHARVRPGSKIVVWQAPEVAITL